MKIKHNFFAIIPARKGSKGVANKNMRVIGGKPLVQFTFDSAKNAKGIDICILSSDDDEIIQLGINKGIQVPFKRPSKLAQDNSKTTDVILHSLSWYKSKYDLMPENIILLQPTSPFRTAKDIDMAISQFQSSSKNTLVSVTIPAQHPGDCMVKNNDGKFSRLIIDDQSDMNLGRQSYPEVVFIDGSIYISDTEQFMKTNNLIGDDPELMLMSQGHSIDIDTQFDLDIARAMHSAKKFNGFEYD